MTATCIDGARNLFRTGHQGKLLRNQFRAPLGRGSLLFFRQLAGPLNGAFPAFFHLFTHRPVILPNRIVGPIGTGIDQHQCPPPILNEFLAGKIVQVAQQPVVKAVGFIRIAPSLKQNERFENLNMSRFLEIALVYDHDRAKDQQEQKQKDKTVLSQKIHSRFLRDHRCERNRELTTSGNSRRHCRAGRPWPCGSLGDFFP